MAPGSDQESVSSDTLPPTTHPDSSEVHPHRPTCGSLQPPGRSASVSWRRPRAPNCCSNFPGEEEEGEDGATWIPGTRRRCALRLFSSWRGPSCPTAVRKSERADSGDAAQGRAERRISALALKPFGYRITPPPTPHRLKGDPQRPRSYRKESRKSICEIGISGLSPPEDLQTRALRGRMRR